jgi:hypothetical protein
MVNLARLRFEIELLDDNAPLGFWGTRLRGGYGDSLKNQLCHFPEFKTCRDCRLFQDRTCQFPFLFKPHSYLFPELPTGKPLGNSENLPVPFVIDSPFEVDTALKKGSRVGFEFTAFGKTLDNIRQVIDAFGKLGQVGLDVKDIRGEIKKARYQLVDVQDLLAAGRSLHVLGNLGSPSIRRASEVIALLRPPSIPAEIVIEFLTPVRLLRSEYVPLESSNATNQKEVARGLRDFYEFIQILANRIGVIRQAYGNDWLGPAEFFRWRNLLLKASKNIRLTEMELYKKTYFRYDKNKRNSIQMDGFTGALHAVGNFADLIDILLLGEILHIGESTAYGFGQYKMVF